MALGIEAQQLGIKAEKLTRTKQSDAFVEQEIRRRTFWSCFIMDRYLSSGKYRPQMLSVKDLRIQLPSSEKAFLFGEKARLKTEGDGKRERFPPWDSRSKFYTLRAMLQKFRDSLPRDLTLTSQNISAHITSRTATPYALVHTVCSLCSIMLNREHVPFIPLRCSGPEGPLDPPTFSPRQYEIPSNFWRDSARDCFKAARDVMDLVRICQEWNVMVETPIVGFTIYTVAFFGVYCGNFPWMDPDGFMCKRNATASSSEDSSGAEVARKSLEVLSQMRSRLRMADGWFKTIERLHLYFGRMKKDWKKNTKALESSSEGGTEVSPEAHRHLSLREGGPGGGLEEYKLLEKTLKEFGALEDDDLEMTDSGVVANEPNPSDAGVVTEIGESQSKPEGTNTMQQGAPNDMNVQQEHWNAINDVAAPPATAQARLSTANTPGIHQTPNIHAHTLANPYQTHPHGIRSGYAG
ncbi:MAG: hypothetical protein Q9165_001027 [Trypethelium subeluteriae]